MTTQTSWTMRLADQIDEALASGRPQVIEVQSEAAAEMGRAAAERMAARDGGDASAVTFRVVEEDPYAQGGAL